MNKLKQFRKPAFKRFFLCATAWLALSPLGAMAVSVDSWTPQASDAATEPQPMWLKQRANRVLPMPQVIELEPLDSETAEKSAARNDAMQLAVGRSVAQTKDSASTATLLQWQDMPDGGKAAAIRIASPQALKVRMGLRIETLPPGTVLRVYGPEAQTEYEIAANEALTTVQRNIQADGDSPAARTYWLPWVEGDEATLEIALAPGVDAAAVAVAVPLVSHQYITLKQAQQKILECNIDAVCKPEYTNEMKAAVLVSVTLEDGGSYMFNGVLLNNTANDGTPYVLTSQMAAASQSHVSSMISMWNLYSASCNSYEVSPDFSALFGGAVLLAADAYTGISLVRLNEPAPAKATFQGWSSDAVLAVGDSIASVHIPCHEPRAMFAEGGVTGHMTCRGGTGDVATSSCAASDQGSGNRYRIEWTQGVTEDDSIGSGLLITRNGQRYLVGLHDASFSNMTCANPLYHSYSRFDQAYARSDLGRWLDPAGTSQTTRVPVFRFYNASTGAHFFTSSESERDFVMINYPAFRYENVAFYAQPSQVSGSSAVFRFYNTSTGAHFYTIDAAEAEAVRTHWPVFNYEGPTWYGRTAAGEGASPLYRFYLEEKGIHFYTISEAEAQAIRTHWPQYHYEGVGYYAWDSQ